ncbi:vacuolar protein-sorting-associated protein 37-2 [Hibiscus syriacus]|uniref:Vacuolar protein-sorting-associated protein 37-2 n=1 Tax=Hibiscus syriacus TaxID=106335 RepID=A0A6A3AQX2_HIBSY|nr:vacuolar protein-sorting-associated protein 37-2 [Hibiscus syriacus]
MSNKLSRICKTILHTFAAGVIALLKEKSVDELRKLLSDNDAYNQFLQSVDQVKIQNIIMMVRVLGHSITRGIE